MHINLITHSIFEKISSEYVAGYQKRDTENTQRKVDIQDC